ncbi:MAG: helix-turn-helix domain-containing protein [Chloroflexota bacterium]
MTDQDNLLSADEHEVLEQIAQRNDPQIEAQRATALLAMADGQSRSDAAAASGLTAGQLDYFLRKFREQRLSAFDPVTQTPMIHQRHPMKIRQRSYGV